MKFGIMAPYRLAPVESGDYARGFAQLVEELGFESVWAVEHAVMCVNTSSVYPYHESGRSPFEADTVQPDPLVWLSWVAAATERLRLATGILILPQRNPVLLAKAVASLDRLSEGRLMLGIGVGWVREEAEAVGSSFEDRGRRADEYVQVLRTLWREPVARYQGEFVRFEGVVSEPRPAREGGVPILVGGHSRAAARRAGRLGDGFYPLGVGPEKLAELRKVMEQEAQAHGRNPSRIEITCAGAPRIEAAEGYHRLGVERMVIFPTHGDLAELRRSLETFSVDVIQKFAS